MSDLKVIRLTTGEELLAEIATIDGTFYRITDIAILYPTDSGSLGLAPFMGYADLTEGLDLDPKDVMFVAPPITDLAAQHAKMFPKSKILTPDQKIIV